MESITHDLRDTMRAALRRPGFALAVLATLGLGIGATISVFSLVDAVLLRPLPYPEADRIVGLWFVSPNFNPDRVRQAEATYIHIRHSNETLEDFGLAEPRPLTVDDGGSPIRVQGALVTPGILRVLGIGVAHGRGLEEKDGLPGAEPVTLLSHGFWTSRFGEDRSVIGQTIHVDGVSRRVIGILPERIRFPAEDVQLWVPLSIDPAAPRASDFIYTGFARLRDGVTPDAAVRDVDRLISTLPDVYPRAFPRRLMERAQIRGLAVPLREEVVGGVRDALWIVYGTVLVVLLLAAANITNLFLVRNESRERELAVRSALGAGTRRIARFLVTESLVYGLAGGAVGLALAALAIDGLRAAAPDAIPRLHEVGIHAGVLGFALGISVLTGLLVALVPALRARRTAVAEVLRSGTRAVGDGRGHVRVRRLLVAGQVALALVLLVNSGLLLRSFWLLQRVDPGFEAGDVLGLRLFLPERDYPDLDGVGRFYMDLIDRLEELPGVGSAAAVSYLPLRDGRIYHPYDFQDFPQEPDEIPPTYLTKVVTDSYFETMGIQLEAGRTLERADIEGATDAVVVSRALAERSWPDGNPLGRRLRYRDTERWYRIVGVVESVRDRGLDTPAAEIVYVPMTPQHMAQRPRAREMSLAIRASNPISLVQEIRGLVAGLDPTLPVFDVRTMERAVRDATARPRYTTALLGVAALGALFLGAVGLYGVVAYAVGQRRREIGVRIALGARAPAVRWMVVRQAMIVAAAGAVLGILATLATTRVIASLLFGVAPTDLPTIVGVFALLLGVTWLSAHIPASRAARIDPALALRNE